VKKQVHGRDAHAWGLAISWDRGRPARPLYCFPIGYKKVFIQSIFCNNMYSNVLFENGQTPAMGETPMPLSPPNQHEPGFHRPSGFIDG
jgi:hypothetical protein